MKNVNGTPYMSGQEARVRCVELVKALQETRKILLKTQGDCIELAQYAAHMDQRMERILTEARTAVTTIPQHVMTPRAVKAALARIIEHATPPIGPEHETHPDKAQDSVPQDQQAEKKPAPVEG